MATINNEMIMAEIKKTPGIQSHFIQKNLNASEDQIKRRIASLIKNKELFVQIDGRKRNLFDQQYATINKVPKKAAQRNQSADDRTHSDAISLQRSIDRMMKPVQSVGY